MKKIVKIAVCVLFVLATVLSLCSCGDSSKTVCVYNWGDYIDPDVIDMFEEETGYKVKYVKFDTNETMYTKLAKGKSAYDVIVPSDYMIEKLIAEDMLLKIDYTNVPNYQYVDENFKDLAYDPTNEYSIPYMWGTLGILYNKTMVNEPIDSWEMLWNEKYKDNIIMYDSSRDSIGITLKMLGFSMNTTDAKELDAAKQKLIEQTGLVSAYVVDEVKDMMIAGAGAMALVWQGDAEYCIKQNSDLEYVIPKEGSNIFCDSMCIPATAKNKAGAEAFINYMCKPEIAAMNALYIGYSTPETEARQYMGEDGKSTTAYPDITAYDLEFFADVGETTKEYDRIWTEIMASIG